MLHNKFHCHQCTLSGRLLNGFTIYGRRGHVGHMTKIVLTTFHSPNPSIYEIWLQVTNGQVLSEEKLFEIVDGRMTRDNRRQSLPIL